MAESTPFSFHCMICYEEFHLANHPDAIYPVVLPCGHTYVCNICAQRLDRCMECRIPLYTTTPAIDNAPLASPPAGPSSTGSPQTTSRSSWASARSGGRTPQSASSVPKKPPPPKKRLPLPKNVVLLSLIEATELATHDVSKKYSGSPSPSRDEATDAPAEQPQSIASVSSIIDHEEDEHEKIKVGTSIATKGTGTFAVAAREGLDILPSRPSNVTLDKDTKVFADEDVDNLVRFFHLDNKEEDGTAKSSSPSGYKSLAKLSFGDRVQVVSVDGGWAKLARGYGYVRADKNQLVKVGNSVDRACRLEAMLQSLSHRRKELRIEQSKVDNQFIRLMSDLQASLQTDEDLTVIVADTFQPVAREEEIEVTPRLIAEEKKMSSPTPSDGQERNGNSSGIEQSIQKPTRLERPSTPPAMNSPSFGCFANEVFNSFDETEGGGLLGSFSVTPRTSLSRDSTSIFPTTSHPSPSEMRAGAQAWRELHGVDAKNVNFKTGLSGHLGLLSTHGRPHEFLEPEERNPSSLNTDNSSVARSTNLRSTNLRMSSHTGLTMSRSRGNLLSLRIPSFGISNPDTGSTPGGGTTGRSSVQQTGSM